MKRKLAAGRNYDEYTVLKDQAFALMPLASRDGKFFDRDGNPHFKRHHRTEWPELSRAMTAAENALLFRADDPDLLALTSLLLHAMAKKSANYHSGRYYSPSFKVEADAKAYLVSAMDYAVTALRLRRDRETSLTYFTVAGAGVGSFYDGLYIRAFPEQREPIARQIIRGRMGKTGFTLAAKQWATRMYLDHDLEPAERAANYREILDQNLDGDDSSVEHNQAFLLPEATRLFLSADPATRNKKIMPTADEWKFADRLVELPHPIKKCCGHIMRAVLMARARGSKGGGKDIVDELVAAAEASVSFRDAHLNSQNTRLMLFSHGCVGISDAIGGTSRLAIDPDDLIRLLDTLEETDLEAVYWYSTIIGKALPDAKSNEQKRKMLARLRSFEMPEVVRRTRGPDITIREGYIASSTSDSFGYFLRWRNKFARELGEIQYLDAHDLIKVEVPHEKVSPGRVMATREGQLNIDNAEEVHVGELSSWNDTVFGISHGPYFLGSMRRPWAFGFRVDAKTDSVTQLLPGSRSVRDLSVGYGKGFAVGGEGAIYEISEEGVANQIWKATPDEKNGRVDAALKITHGQAMLYAVTEYANAFCLDLRTKISEELKLDLPPHPSVRLEWVDVAYLPDEQKVIKSEFKNRVRLHGNQILTMKQSGGTPLRPEIRAYLDDPTFFQSTSFELSDTFDFIYWQDHFLFATGHGLLAGDPKAGRLYQIVGGVDLEVFSLAAANNKLYLGTSEGLLVLSAAQFEEFLENKGR
ncbi:hypothetical protein [Stratiformator vulcanicus]|uniref:hypothetical protein n=1 Tax=Stratiformator vulcanicus TaxID=2527980 RepID=UPI0011A8EDAB|nr:hypothetical protein [Stratiformator vulcanicus]